MSNTMLAEADSASSFIEATALSRVLRERVIETDRPKVPSYGALKPAMYDGRIPSEKVRGRLCVQDADVPVIARAFGLTLASNVPTEASKAA